MFAFLFFFFWLFITSQSYLTNSSCLYFKRLIVYFLCYGSWGTRYWPQWILCSRFRILAISRLNPAVIATVDIYLPFKYFLSQIISVPSQCIIICRAWRGPKTEESGMKKKIKSIKNETFSPPVIWILLDKHFILNLYSLEGVKFEHEAFFDMHVCFFTKPNMAIFIFCFIVIAYILPSVFTLPLTFLFFCNLKNQNWCNKMLVTLLRVHSWVPTMWHKFSMTGSFFLMFFFFTRDMPWNEDGYKGCTAQWKRVMLTHLLASFLLLWSSVAVFVIIQLV